MRDRNSLGQYEPVMGTKCSVEGCNSVKFRWGRCYDHWNEKNNDRMREYRNRDKAKHAKYMREYFKKNPDKAKNHHLKKRFGITLEAYNEMWEVQGGVCAICGKPETVVDNRTKLPRSLAVDHDHVTDEVRGLLCMACNQGVGNFREDPETMRKAAKYIEERKSTRIAPPATEELLG